MKRALLVLAWASSAHADVLHATRGQALAEVAHTVDIRIEDGVAVYKVRRVFANTGLVADEAQLSIDLPAGAAATGLRIRAHDTWFDGELMEREKAAALYHELTGLGAYKPKDPALLQWMWADKLHLQIFPVMPGGISTVEYTLTVPTRYSGARYWVSYPRVAAAASTGVDGEGQTLPLVTPIITVHPAWGSGTTPITVDGKRAVPDTGVALVPPVRPSWAELVDASPSASYVSSTLAVPELPGKSYDKVTLVLDIAHTYKSDVRVELLTPEGQRVVVFDRAGGGDNNIRGTFPLAIPGGTKGTGTWRLVASDHVGLDTGSIDKWSLDFASKSFAAKDLPVFIPDAPQDASDAGVAAISVAPPPIDVLAARFGRVEASDKHAFARLEIDVAPELRPLPKRAQVVFAIDASYSIGEVGLADELRLVHAYLAHVPDAEVELVAYRRRAERVFGAFVAAKDLDAALAKHPIALGNGSALDDAERVAIAALAGRNAGPRRLVITTDKLLRSALRTTAAIGGLATLPADVVVHVVFPQGYGTPELERDDHDALAPIATSHHGIFASLAGADADLKSLTPVALELVRPTRIDQLAVAGIVVEDKLLPEGGGVRAMVADKTAAKHVSIRGKLWSDPIRREVQAEPAFCRATAAFVFGADEHHDLTNEEMMKVALEGRAVSPVTSYVAFEPGTRPSTIGLGEYATIGHGMGTGSGYGAGSGRITRIPPDLKQLVDPDKCHPPRTWHATLSVETTKDEIVDIAITRDEGGVASCLAEQLWLRHLDPSAFSDERQQFLLDW